MGLPRPGPQPRFVAGTPAQPWDLAEPQSMPPAALPLVFVHGTRLSRAAWGPQLDRLGRSHRCVALDLPGHGLRAAEAFTLAGAVEAIERAIDEAAAGRAIVVGLSLGGYVAMELAASSPDRVAGLVLAGATREPAGVAGLPYRLLAFAFERLPARFGRLATDAFFRLRFGALIADRVAAGGYWSRGGAVALRALVGRRYAPRLAEYGGPVLIMNGELDLLFRLGEPGFLAAAPAARRVRLRRATHLSNLAAPAAFSRAVARFADDLAGWPTGGPVLD